MEENIKYKQLEQIILDYQDDFEADSEHKKGYWLRKREEAIESFDEKCKTISTDFEQALYEAENLGFVQGLSFALDLTMMTDKGENRELVEKVRNVMEFNI